LFVTASICVAQRPGTQPVQQPGSSITNSQSSWNVAGWAYTGAKMLGDVATGNYPGAAAKLFGKVAGIPGLFDLVKPDPAGDQDVDPVEPSPFEYWTRMEVPFPSVPVAGQSNEDEQEQIDFFKNHPVDPSSDSSSGSSGNTQAQFPNTYDGSSSGSSSSSLPGLPTWQEV